MNSDKKAAGTMLDVRIILAALWMAGMLSSLNGDTYRLSDPATMKSILANTTAIKTTPGMLTAAAVIFVIPVFMSALTLMLKHPVSRTMNRITGTLYAVITLAFFVLNFVLRAASYEFVWSTAQLVFALLVVWYAWKWPGQEA